MNNYSDQIKLKNPFLLLSTEKRKLLFFLIKIMIAAGLILFLITWIRPSEILVAIKNANLIFILSAASLLLPNIYLQFLKWKLTSLNLLQEADNKKIFNSLFYGLAAGVFTPARVGEYLGRGIVFSNQPIIKVTIATFVDKLFLLVIVAFFGSLTSIMFIHSYYKVSSMITAGLLIVIIILFYLLFIFLIRSDYWQQFLKLKFNSVNKFKIFFESLSVVNEIDKSYSARMIFLSILLYACFIIQYALLVMAFSNNSNFLQYIIAGNLMMFSKSIVPPISLGELGIREGASIFFITQVGESANVGFNASIFLFLINILLPALIGFVLLLKKNND